MSSSSVSLSHRAAADIARQLEKLGVGADALTSKEKALEALEGVKGKHVKELKASLSSLSKADLKALREAVGEQHRDAAAEFKPGRTGVGGPGVMRHNVEEKLKGHGKHANSPEVAKLLAHYEPHGPDHVGRPFERILAIVDIIEKMIVGDTPEEVVAHLLKHDARRQVFLLEGQCRLYRKGLGDTAVDALVVVKQLEDQLGAVCLWKSMGELATELGCPAPVVQNLADKETAARAQLVDTVRTQWMPNPEKRNQVPAFNKMIKHMVDEKWGSYSKDREYLCEQVANQFTKIETRPYDFHDLLNGIHRFRKDLRWITIYVEAVNGLMQLDPGINPVETRRNLLEDPLANSKFVKLPAPDREKEPVQLSKSLYVAMMKAVLELGAIKDQGEQEEFLSQAYLESGVAGDLKEAEAMVRQRMGNTPYPDTHDAASKVYADLVTSGVLAQMRKLLEEA